MRYISREGKQPDAAWLTKANKLLQQLKDAPDKATRDAIIDGNKPVWGELKDWLLSLSHDKCWFSEAKDVYNYWHVEHFRPKKYAINIDGTKSDGYWWLAFDWKNFRICGSVGNTKKGTHFPLREGCPRIAVDGDTRLEDVMLLDPADEDDPALLFFDPEGQAIAAPFVKDEWEKRRVEYSIERLKLNYDPLARKRKTLWNECNTKINKYLSDLEVYLKDKTNLVAKNSSKEAARDLRSMTRAHKEFSAVAEACIRFRGDARVNRLLQQ
jgi:uncharacterized protein (TIGR02646 family)